MGGKGQLLCFAWRAGAAGDSEPLVRHLLSSGAGQILFASRLVPGDDLQRNLVPGIISIPEQYLVILF